MSWKIATRLWAKLLVLCWVCALPSSLRGGEKAEPSWIIILDAGHGGTNTGAFGPAVSAYEKEIALALTLRIRHWVHRLIPTARVVLTRNSDQYVPIRQRVRFANDANAHLFVSIHLNASVEHNRRGHEAFVLSEEIGRRELTRILRKPYQPEKSSLDAAHDLEQILIDLKHAGLWRRSKHLGRLALSKLGPVFGATHDRGVREAPIDVLRGLMMPGVLVEVGFLDHADEAKMLANVEIQDQIGKALAEAILGYTAAWEPSTLTNSPHASR